MDTPSQRRISAASAPITKPAGVMNSAFDTSVTPVTGKQRGPRDMRLPELDLSKLTPVNGLPPAFESFAKGVTKYDALFDLLKADGTGRTNIPLEFRSALIHSSRRYLKARPELAGSTIVVRRTGDGMCGVWRVAKRVSKAKA